MTQPTKLKLLPDDENLSFSLNTTQVEAQKPSSFKHLFELSHIHAVNAALACNRPLLLTGEPGVGKTQLARAVAVCLGRAYVRHTVDSRTESRDLLWEFDAVARLAEAQTADARGLKGRNLDRALKLENFLRPGPLWWAFNWSSAENLKCACAPHQPDGGSPKNGVVVLIDEIDKADSDVPNGLLEALGEGSFQPDGNLPRVRMGAVAPLIIITSNRERSLPAAFMRRCLELKMALPQDEQLKTHLVKRGRAHFPDEQSMPDDALAEAADQLIKDREACEEAPYPGLAEYLDLLRAVKLISRQQSKTAEDVLKEISQYVLLKGANKAIVEHRADAETQGD